MHGERGLYALFAVAFVLALVIVILAFVSARDDERACHGRGGEIHCTSMTGVSFRGDPVFVSSCGCTR